jgi:DNA-binding PadR family transcriptional regulator
MTKKTNDLTFKELGSLQEKVLFFVAENPEKHKQGIQQDINHPADQYGSVKNAVDKLEELGYIESTTALSKKKVEIKLFWCTESGIFYALTRNPSADIPKILEANKSKIPFCKAFYQLYTVWGKDNFVRYLNDTVEYLPMIQKNGITQTLPYLFIQAVKEMKDIDPETRKQNIIDALKMFPEVKEILKEWKRSSDELLQLTEENNKLLF